MTFLVPPGATPIDDDDLEHLMVFITMQPQLDAFEFDNIHKAHEKYFRSKKLSDVSWFTEQFLQQLHRDMFGEVWFWSGKYRTKDVQPVGVAPYKIAIMISELAKDIEYWLLHPTDITFLEMAARMHQRLTWIHPFPNGNGRFSRFVSDLFLFSYRCSLPIWLVDLNRAGTDRSRYLEVLREADKGNYKSFITYLTLLGAKNPTLGQFIGSKIYHSFRGERLKRFCLGLLNLGENVNDNTWNGHRPLQLVLRRNEAETALFLMENAADIHSADHSGLTPFQVAVVTGNKSIADLLLSRGAKKIIPPGLGYVNYYAMYGQ